MLRPLFRPEVLRDRLRSFAPRESLEDARRRIAVFAGLLGGGRAGTPSQIARLFEVDTGAVTRLTHRLERGGFLQRRVSLSDRRSIRVEATPEGRDLLEAALPLALAQSRRFCSGMSAADLTALVSLLRNLLKLRSGGAT